MNQIFCNLHVFNHFLNGPLGSNADARSSIALWSEMIEKQRFLVGFPSASESLQVQHSALMKKYSKRTSELIHGDRVFDSWVGCVLLRHLFRDAPRAAIGPLGSWVAALQSCLSTSSPAAAQKAAILCSMELICRCSKDVDLQREITLEHLSKLVNHIMELSSSTDCKADVMQFMRVSFSSMPNANRSYVAKATGIALENLTSSQADVREAASSLITTIPVCFPETAQKLLQQIVASLHYTFNTLFDIRENDDRTDKLPLTDIPSFDEPLSCASSVTRVTSLIACIKGLLSNDQFTAVAVPLGSLFGFIYKVMDLNIQRVVLETHQLDFSHKTVVLFPIQAEVTELLIFLLNKYGKHLVLEFHILSKCIVRCIDRMRSIMQTYLLKRLYACLVEFYAAFGWQAVDATINSLVDELLSNVQMNPWKYDDTSESKTKKQKTQVSESVSELTKEETYSLSLASLNVFEAIFKQSGGYLPQNIYKRIELVILKQLLSAVSCRGTYPDTYILGLLRVLFQLLLAPSNAQPASLNLALRLYQQANRACSTTVASYCQDCIRIMEIYLHPRSSHRLPPPVLTEADMMMVPEVPQNYVAQRQSNFSFESVSNRISALESSFEKSRAAPFNPAAEPPAFLDEHVSSQPSSQHIDSKKANEEFTTTDANANGSTAQEIQILSQPQESDYKMTGEIQSNEAQSLQEMKQTELDGPIICSQSSNDQKTEVASHSETAETEREDEKGDAKSHDSNPLVDQISLSQNQSHSEEALIPSAQPAIPSHDKEPHTSTQSKARHQSIFNSSQNQMPDSQDDDEFPEIDMEDPE